MHSTNYFDTLIQVADDCPVHQSETPKDNASSKTMARLQYELLSQNPYQYSSDDVLFEIFALRNDISKSEYPEAREAFFSKGQPCFRASALCKRYGFGVHANADGQLALCPMESAEYNALNSNDNVKKVKAMRTAKRMQ